MASPPSPPAQPPSDPDAILVVGAGVGGLSLAISLIRAGLSVRIFERDQSLSDMDLGLVLWSNALRVLRTLDVYPKLVHLGEHNVGFGLATSGGRILTELPAREQTRGGMLEQLCISRGDLLRVLEASLPPKTITFGAWCRGLKEDRSGVGLRFEYTPSTRGKVVIGADGANSAIRRELFGFQRPRYAGYTCWQGVAPSVGDDLDFRGEVWGRGARFRIVPIGGGRVYWLATETAPSNQKFPDDERKTWVKDRYAGWAFQIPDLIEATPAAAILQHDIVDRPPEPVWGKGRVILMGDAAHPVMPNLAQGAGMAIEDAAVLGRLLGRQQKLSQVLRRFQAIRQERVELIHKRSRELGTLAHLPNHFACWARNRTLGMVSTSTLRKRLLEVIDHDASVESLT